MGAGQGIGLGKKDEEAAQPRPKAQVNLIGAKKSKRGRCDGGHPQGATGAHPCSSTQPNTARLGASTRNLSIGRMLVALPGDTSPANQTATQPFVQCSQYSTGYGLRVTGYGLRSRRPSKTLPLVMRCMRWTGDGICPSGALQDNSRAVDIGYSMTKADTPDLWWLERRKTHCVCFRQSGGLGI